MDVYFLCGFNNLIISITTTIQVHEIDFIEVQGR